MATGEAAGPQQQEGVNRAAERRRRRGLYGPPPRLTPTSPLAGRLLWHIGDWGRASEHIGGRWEVVGAALLRDTLPSDSTLVLLAGTPALMAVVHSSGLPHADALRAWAEDGQLALEPLDFKWSLETASARQVSAETLQRLLEAQLPLLEAALASARTTLGLPPDAPVAPHDGRFVAPEHPANRSALRAEPTLPARQYPLDAQAFFQPLPGWPTAVALARFERVDLARLRDVEAVERWYRLGAGVSGALTRLAAGLFDTEPRRVDTAAAVDVRRAQRRETVNQLLLDLERRLADRRALDERLSSIAHVAYPFGQLRSDLTKLQVPRGALESRGVLGRAHGEVMRVVGAAVREAGRKLLATGMAELEALEVLAGESERWARLGRREARRLAATLGAKAPPSAEPAEG